MQDPSVDRDSVVGGDGGGELAADGYVVDDCLGGCSAGGEDEEEGRGERCGAGEGRFED